MAAIQDFSFDDDQVSGGGFKKADPKLKFKKSEKARLSLALWPVNAQGVPQIEGSQPRLRRCSRFFFEKIGYVVRPDGNEGKEFDALAAEEAKTVYATVVIRWPLNPDGSVNMKELTSARAVVWTPSKQAIDAIKLSIKQEVDFSKYDLFVECTDEQFQKLTIATPPKNLYALLQQQKPQFFQDLLTQVEQKTEEMNYHMGREMSIADLRAKMGLGGGEGSGAAGGAQPVSQVDSADLEAMLDGLG